MSIQSSESATARLPRHKKVVFFSILILLTIIPFLLLEVYVRNTFPYTDLWVQTGLKIGPSPIKAWGFVDAFAGYSGRPGTYEVNKTINDWGFISTPDIALAKPPNTLRILFLGGSATAGSGINLADDITWPWQATEILQDRFPTQKFEFINGALAGYTTFESYGRLWSKLRFFSPDIIILYQGWNEMYYFNEVDEITSWRTLPDGDWTLDRIKAPVTIYAPLPIDYLIGPSQALTHLRLRLTDPVGGEVSTYNTIADDYDKRGLEIWRTNLRLFQETAKVLGAELFVAKQATLIVSDLPEAERARARYEYHGFDHDAHVDAFQQLYRIIDEEVAAERVIDVTEISGRPEYFYDHIHPTPEGASQIAEIVADTLTTCFNAQ